MLFVVDTSASGRCRIFDRDIRVAELLDLDRDARPDEFLADGWVDVAAGMGRALGLVMVMVGVILVVDVHVQHRADSTGLVPEGGERATLEFTANDKVARHGGSPQNSIPVSYWSEK